MKQLTEYNRVAGYLNKIFDLLNQRYFENALSKPIITIQSTPRAYGHVSVQEIWQSGEANRRELNIGAGTINRPIEEVVATLLHEMVHIYNMQNGVQDCSRGGAYHNKKFRDEATKRDLHIDHHPTYGWTLTTPTDNLVAFCVDNDLTEIKVVRHEFAPRITPPTGKTGNTPTATPTATPTTTRKPSSTRKLLCPCCGASVRATREIKIICGECYEKDQSINYMQQAEG